MPKVVDNCVQNLKANGIPEDQAWAICTAAHKEGRLGEQYEEEANEDDRE